MTTIGNDVRFEYYDDNGANSTAMAPSQDASIWNAAPQNTNVNTAGEQENAEKKKTFLEMFNFTCHKNYQSCREIPKEELIKFIGFFMQINGATTPEGMMNGFCSLISSFNGLGAEDVEYMKNVLKDSAPESDITAKYIEMLCNMSKEELYKYAQDPRELIKICKKDGVDAEKIFQVYTKLSHENDLDNEENVLDMSDKLKVKNIVEKIQEDVNNGKTVSDDDQKLLDNYKQFKIIVTKSMNGQITIVEEEFAKSFIDEVLNKYKEYKTDYDGGAVTYNNSLANVIKEHCGEEHFNEVLQKVAKFAQMDDTIKIDTELLDQLSGGKYSEYVKELEVNTNAGQESAGGELGFSQKSEANAGEAYTIIRESIKNMYAQNKQENFTVERTKSPEKTENKEQTYSKKWLLSTISTVKEAKDAGLTAFDAAKEYSSDLSFAMKQWVRNTFDKMNNKDTINTLNIINKTDLTMEIAKVKEFTTEQIEKLNINSFARKVMTYAYEQTHKNEERKGC